MLTLEAHQQGNHSPDRNQLCRSKVPRVHFVTDKPQTEVAGSNPAYLKKQDHTCRSSTSESIRSEERRAKERLSNQECA